MATMQFLEGLTQSQEPPAAHQADTAPALSGQG